MLVEVDSANTEIRKRSLFFKEKTGGRSFCKYPCRCNAWRVLLGEEEEGFYRSARQGAGQPRDFVSRGKSGLHETRVAGNARRGQP